MKRTLTRFFILSLSICSNAFAQDTTGSKRSSEAGSSRTENWRLQTADQSGYLYISEVGKGEPVIVLHGGSCAGFNYMVDISSGLEEKYRFVFYDQRGCGYSYFPMGAISLQHNVDDLELLRKALGVDRLNLLSHSAGTTLAMSYLEAYPDHVKNIVMVGAQSPLSNSIDHLSTEEWTLVAKINEERTKFANRPEVETEIKHAGLDGQNLSPKQEAELSHLKMAASNIFHIEKWKMMQPLFVNAACMDAMSGSYISSWDWTIALSKHNYPVTVINGDYDLIIGPKESPVWKRVANKNAKNVKVKIIKDAGHICWTDDPENFRNLLEQALK